MVSTRSLLRRAGHTGIGAEVSVLTDDECRYMEAVLMTDRPGFVREIEEVVLIKVVEIAREYMYCDSDFELFAKRMIKRG